MSETISIVYFSGTGGAERVARAFDHSLRERKFTTNVIALDHSGHVRHDADEDASFANSTRVILVFALHAFDAPDPVYHWLEQTNGSGKRIAVISVSGGGEVWPNTGCRHKVNQLLQKQGFYIDYEKMMVMPCNWVFPVNDHLAMWLITTVPDKVNKILDRLLAGHTRRTKHRLGWFRKGLRYLEKKGSKTFGRDIAVTEKCTACGWCERNCPVNNISMVDKRPAFADRCVMCFRCIYGCPLHAMTSKNFMVLKKGFSISVVEERMKGIALQPIEACCKGMFWAGARNYLNDKDGY